MEEINIYGGSLDTNTSDPTAVTNVAAEQQPKTQTIDKASLQKANQTLEKYKAGKANLDERIIKNEEWYRLRHWQYIHKDKANALERIEMGASGWLFNSMANKHADAMDSFPEPAILARSQDDEATAKQLSSIVPVIMDACDFEQTYSDNWWDKIKNGTAIYSVLWNPKAFNGLGDVDIKAIDILSIYWEPGVTNIQDSQNIFVLNMIDNDVLEDMYPELKGKLNGYAIDKKQYHYDDTVDTSDKTIVIDWYYKLSNGSKPVVHYVKYVGDTVLFASENEAGYENGWYNHGQYPFVFDVLYGEKGTPAGFGYVDLCKGPQEYIDRLGTAILLNSEEAAKRRYIVKDNASINDEELADINKRIIHCAGSPNDDNFRELSVSYLSGTYLSVLQDKVNELKEISSNRDFNQGGTSSGVTAASAISALQESGNKTSRDINKSSYRAYSKICTLVVELIRQFYDYDRVFRILGADGNNQYMTFNNSAMQGGTQVIAGQEFKTKEPSFDIVISAQKKNPYSKLSQNELALQFFNAGFFNPQLVDQVLPCIDMMDFDGKEKVRQMVQNNGDMYQQLQQMKEIVTMAGQALAEKGDSRVLQAIQQMGIGTEEQSTTTVPTGGAVNMEEVNDASENP